MAGGSSRSWAGLSCGRAGGQPLQPAHCPLSRSPIPAVCLLLPAFEPVAYALKQHVSVYVLNTLRPFLPMKYYCIGQIRGVPLAEADEGSGTQTSLFEVPGPRGITSHFTHREPDSREGKSALQSCPCPVGSSSAGGKVDHLPDEETGEGVARGPSGPGQGLVSTPLSTSPVPAGGCCCHTSALSLVHRWAFSLAST